MYRLSSMTTFASSSLKTKEAEYQIRLRSLNSRFLDLKLAMPQDLISLEEEIRKLVASVFKRGKVDIQINIKKSHSETASHLVFDAKLLKKAHQTLKKIAKDNQLKYDSIADLTQTLPLLNVESDVDVSKTDCTKVITTLKTCLADANKQRKKEGAALAKNLKDLLVEIDKDLQQIERLRSIVTKKAFANIENKISKLNLKEIEPYRLEQEVVIWIDKSDIHEEIMRLQEHLRNFEAIMKEGSGKKLDFYTQELLRETNTIGSKAQDIKITATVVNMKCHIERIRELVQNVE